MSPIDPSEELLPEPWPTKRVSLVLALGVVAVLVGFCALMGWFVAHSMKFPILGEGKLAQADQLAAAGKLAEAVRLYGELAREPWWGETLVGVSLNGENPLRDAARQDSDVRRAVDLIRGAYRDAPEHEASPWAWSLLNAIDPDEGAKLAQTYLENEFAQLAQAIQQRVKPVSAATALSAFWAAEMVGKNADGPAILEAYAARGVPLPIE